MTTPETIVPTKPEDRMTISTTGSEIIVWNVSEMDVPGDVKYSDTLLSPTITEITIGYRTDISHVLRNNIFKIKAIPKNITKYSTMERKIWMI